MEFPNNCINCGHEHGQHARLLGFNTPDGSVTCTRCDYKVWDNPIPVAVCIQPVILDPSTKGLAIAKRAIEPRLGTWNLIGGHVDNGETIEEAARREWNQETGLNTGELLGITRSYANGKGHVLIGVEYRPISYSYWKTARLCPENSEFSVCLGPDDVELGFPIHKWIADRWFETH